MFSLRFCLASDKFCSLCFDPAKFRNNQVRIFFDPTQSWTNCVHCPFNLLKFLNNQISLCFDLSNVWNKQK
jgi:hypothetical protein